MKELLARKVDFEDLSLKTIRLRFKQFVHLRCHFHAIRARGRGAELNFEILGRCGFR